MKDTERGGDQSVNQCMRLEGIYVDMRRKADLQDKGIYYALCMWQERIFNYKDCSVGTAFLWNCGSYLIEFRSDPREVHVNQSLNHLLFPMIAQVPVEYVSTWLGIGHAELGVYRGRDWHKAISLIRPK